MRIIQFLQCLCTQPRHIHSRRTLSLARLAGQTRCQHLFQLSLTYRRIAAQPFPQHIRPGTRRLQLIPAHLICRTHRSTYQLRLPAISGSVTMLHTAKHLRVLNRFPVTEHSQPLIHLRRIHDLMRIENFLFVPAVFHFTHQLIRLLPVLQRNELPSQSSVAMLSADCTAMFPNQQRRLMRNLPEQTPSFFRLQVQNRP